MTRLWRWLSCLMGHRTAAALGVDHARSKASTTDVELGSVALIDLGRPGWPVWYDLWYHARLWFCLHSGGHVSAGGYAPMLCTRCHGTLYDKDAGWTRTHGVRGLWWRQVNRYRDTLRPLALRYPRAFTWIGLAACPECGDLQHPSSVADCDVCAFTRFSEHNMRHFGEWMREEFGEEEEK